MSPTKSNNPNSSNNNPAGSNVIVFNNDLRCRFCGHNRSKCSVCRTPRSHSGASDRRKAKKVPMTRRRKAYCCNCKHKNKLVRLLGETRPHQVHWAQDRCCCQTQVVHPPGPQVRTMLPVPQHLRQLLSHELEVRPRRPRIAHSFSGRLQLPDPRPQ
jgi:hypothetical protein